MMLMNNRIAVISPTSDFANVTFANVFGRVANAMSRFANVLPCIYVGPLCFKLRVQEKETKSEQNNGRKLSSNGEIKSAQSSK